jgi:serine/threonine-protein kinase/endoribonuclease IRE1
VLFLAGRSVAVKRMLKNYHASADREISLLIESDGHPNVVRYFFKEIRGDFVYLALEMCDASLHDLITSVARGVTKQNYDQHVLAYVTKKVLFHIVLGVKHLHDLRIVHRDLKPQNILLAHKNRCENSFHLETDDSFDQLFLGFMNDNFLPKISDMGLGKQLTSQSSYGVSTKGVEFHEGSTIGGAGPGSVGWQAPEVMARRSMDLPVKSVDQCTDSKDGSPTPDGSLNTRTSRSVDIFSLGCVFFSTLLPGSHPFGEW